MAAVSQKDIDRAMAVGTKIGGASGDAASAGAKNPRLRKFAGLYKKNFSGDNSCALTQDELDRVLGEKK
jgi:hypothetical protein